MATIKLMYTNMYGYSCEQHGGILENRSDYVIFKPFGCSRRKIHKNNIQEVNRNVKRKI